MAVWFLLFLFVCVRVRECVCVCVCVRRFILSVEIVLFKFVMLFFQAS